VYEDNKYEEDDE
jgi:hypothetical protein